MGRSIRSVNSQVFGNIITDDLTSTGLLSPQGGSENIIGYTVITTSSALLDVDGVFYVANGGITITLPATSTEGRYLQFIDGSDWAASPITLARNGNTINGSAVNLTVNVSLPIFLVYVDGNWTINFYN